MEIARKVVWFLWKRIVMPVLVGIAGLVILYLLAFAIFPQVRAATHTVFFVLQVLDLSIKPQSWFTGEAIREEVTYPGPSGALEADIYRIPDGKPRAAILIFLGANAAGREDKDVVNLGYAISRAGFVTMIHWSETMGQRANVDPEEMENLVRAFQHLAGQDYVRADKAGMAGFSVGGSFTMVAAADPRINQEVVFVNSMGAYYDSRDLFVQIASNSWFPARYEETESVGEREVEPWRVDKLTRRVFRNELLEPVEVEQQREALAVRFGEDEAAAAAITLPPLTGTAPVVKSLLEGPTPTEAAKFMEQMPAPFLGDLDFISPSNHVDNHVDNLHARLLIMHDQGDKLIPVGESRRFAEAVGDRDNVLYTETNIFDHVRPGGDRSWSQLGWGALKLGRHMYHIMRYAH